MLLRLDTIEYQRINKKSISTKNHDGKIVETPRHKPRSTIAKIITVLVFPVIIFLYLFVLKITGYTNSFGQEGTKLKLGDDAGVITNCTKAIKITSNDATAHHNQDSFKHLLADFEKADAEFWEACNSALTQATVHNERGDAKKQLSDYSGAITDYSKAIELNPNDSTAYSNRGSSKYQLADYRGAIADFSKAIEITPKDDWIYYNRAAAKCNLGDYAGAISDFSKAAELNPENDWARRNIEQLLRKERETGCTPIAPSELEE